MKQLTGPRKRNHEIRKKRLLQRLVQLKRPASNTSSRSTVIKKVPGIATVEMKSNLRARREGEQQYMA